MSAASLAPHPCAQVAGLQGNEDTSDVEEQEEASGQLEAEAPRASGELCPAQESAEPCEAAAAAAAQNPAAGRPKSVVISPMLSSPSPLAPCGEDPVTQQPSAGGDSVSTALPLPENVPRVSAANKEDECHSTALISGCGLRTKRAPSQPSVQPMPVILTCEMKPTSDLGKSVS